MGIDVGTTGVKAMVVNTKGEIISSSYREYNCSYPNPGWVEQSAGEIIRNTFQACRDTLEKSSVDNIEAVGFSAQRATFALVDEKNEVIEDRLYVWQDNRAATEMEYIKSKMDPYEMYCIQGQPITPTFSLEKIVWVMRNDREVYDKAKKIVMVPDYILYKFGVEEFLCEVSNAGCSSLVDIKNDRWSDEILDRFSIDKDKFPRLIEPGVAVGKVSKGASLLCGLKEGTIICSGSGDNQCGALGAGVLEEGHASMSLGTSGVLVVGSKKPLLLKDMGLMVGRALAPNLYELEGIQLGAASSYRWMRDVFCKNEIAFGEEVHMDPYDLMELYVKKSPVGANGVIFMPYLVGAGYPHWNMDAKGLFTGITFSTTKSHMIRAVMEGITLESKDMYENLKRNGIKIRKLSIIGGATKSKAWRQMIADMFNVEVKKLKVSDSTIIGACILAGVGVGIFKDTAQGVESMVNYESVVKPIKENVKKYDEVYEKFKNIYESMSKNKSF
jgi:xylulokinase